MAIISSPSAKDSPQPDLGPPSLIIGHYETLGSPSGLISIPEDPFQSLKGLAEL